MGARIESGGWSGEGDFTRRHVEEFAAMDDVAEVRVEDSPASRTDVAFAFLANEIYVRAATRTVRRRVRSWTLPVLKGGSR